MEVYTCRWKMVDCQEILTAYKGKIWQSQFYEDSSDRGCGRERKTVNNFSLFNVYMFNIYDKYMHTVSLITDTGEYLL